LAKEYKKNIGKILRKYRLAAKLSQMALAEKIGISYQQLQKYEKGIDNISIYRLHQLSGALEVPISKFLEIEEPENVAEDIVEYGISREEKTLVELFRKIDNKDIRHGLLLELKGIVEAVKKN
jgi:transcriptional regulator with XRE-family HTH domain